MELMSSPICPRASEVSYFAPADFEHLSREAREGPRGPPKAALPQYTGLVAALIRVKGRHSGTARNEEMCATLISHATVAKITRRCEGMVSCVCNGLCSHEVWGFLLSMH